MRSIFPLVAGENNSVTVYHWLSERESRGVAAVDLRGLVVHNVCPRASREVDTMLVSGMLQESGGVRALPNFWFLLPREIIS